LKCDEIEKYYICRKCGENIIIEFLHCPICGTKKWVDHYVFDLDLIKNDFKSFKNFCDANDLSYNYSMQILHGIKNLTKKSQTFKKTPKKYIKLKP
jgi:hypothetical protein